MKYEVTDFQVVLRNVSTVLTEREPPPDAKVSAKLKRAENLLMDIDESIRHVDQNCVRGKKFISRAAVWWREKPRLQALQEDLHSIKASLSVLFSASISQDMLRVQLDLQEVSLITSDISRNQINAIKDNHERHQQITFMLQESHQRMEQHLQSIEQKFSQYPPRLHLCQSANFQDLSLDSASGQYKNVISQGNQNNTSKGLQGQLNTSRALRIRARDYDRVNCQAWCPCVCHNQRSLATSGLLGHIMGRLFVGYTGLPFTGKSCNVASCRLKQTPFVNMEYWFPPWFLHYAVRLNIAFQSAAGLHLQLRTLRRVPDSAECVRFALTGNIDGMRELFVKGLASPQDVSFTRGYSITRWAIYHHKYEMAKFLVHAGADTDQNDAADKVWDKLLQGLIKKDEEDTVRCLLDRSDFVEDQNFPTAHKIVLGISFQSLDDLFSSDAAAVHQVDFSGRTALAWAAMRGDDRSVATLLSYGADPNIVDKKHESALSCCCVTGKTVCARLLLEAGAHTKVILPPGVGKSSPLMCAGQYPGNDPFLLKTLIEFGADVNARNPEGETAVHKIAQFTTAAHARILLENNADLNIYDKNGKRPLIMAIIHNNHSVLQLLLDFWFKYTSCPRQHGPGLLHYVASYANATTISMIASAEHVMLHPDKVLASGKSELETVQQRPDADEKLLDAFEDLLRTIRREKMRKTFAALEASLPHPHPKTNVLAGNGQDALPQRGLLDSPRESDERWYSPVDTMQSSLASLDEFEDVTEGPIHA